MYDETPPSDTYPPRTHEDLAGLPYDEFVTHAKIAHTERMNGISTALTLGLGEFICFPWSLYDTGHNLLIGERLRFVYDSDGAVKGIIENGERYFGPR